MGGLNAIRRVDHRLPAAAQGRRPRRGPGPLGAATSTGSSAWPAPSCGVSRPAATRPRTWPLAFDSVYRRAERGPYERLDDRDNLWSLLFVVTYRKRSTTLAARAVGPRAPVGSPPWPTWMSIVGRGDRPRADPRPVPRRSPRSAAGSSTPGGPHAEPCGNLEDGRLLEPGDRWSPRGHRADGRA